MNPDLDTLATRLYVTIDDLLIDHPEWAPERLAVGIAPRLTDAELITLAVIQALIGFTSEAQFFRYARTHLTPWFRYLPDRPGYNKRLRRSGQLMQHLTGHLARTCPSWTDDLWLVDSTPVECGRSRETAKRSDLAGWATYGYFASHSRYFWGLRLHLITTPSGLPIAYALTGARTDERDTALDMIAFGGLDTAGQTMIADKGYRSAAFETELNQAGMNLPQPEIGADPARSPLPQSVPPDHRIGQPDPQSPARSRTPRRPDQTRGLRPRTATHPRPHHSNLAQRNCQPRWTCPITHRVRPLTPWNQSSRGSTSTGEHHMKRALSEYTDLLTVEEASEYLRISRALGYQLTRQYRIAKGDAGLPVVQVGRCLRVPRRALARFITDGGIKAAEPPTATYRST